MSRLILFLFFVAAVIAGVVGTETRLLFLWPVCLIFGLAGLAVVLGPRVRVPYPPSDLCLATALVFGIYFGVRAVMSPVIEHAREDFFVIASALVAYVIMVTVAARPGARLGFLAVVLVLVLGNLTVGLIHFGGNWGYHLVPHFVRSFEEGRIGGFYNNPNHLAAFFSLAVFMCLGQLCFGRGRATWRLVLGFVIVSSMIGMALTVSRGALLGLAAGGFIFAVMGIGLVWKCHRHLAMKLITATFALALVLGGVLWKVNESFLRRRIEQQATTSDVREWIWKSGLAQHAEQPLTGAGARMFYEGGVRLRQPEMSGWVGEPEFVHNEYLQALADYGWIGLLVLLLALLVHLWNGVRFVRWYASEKFPLSGSLMSSRLALAVGAVAAIVASAAHALVEFHWHVGGLAVMTACLVGILANPGFEGLGLKSRRIPGVRPVLKFTLLAYSIGLVVGVAVWGRADWMHATALIQAEGKEAAAALMAMEKAGSLDPQSAAKAYDRAQLRLDIQARTESGEARKVLLDGARVDLEQAAVRNPFDFLIATNLSDVYSALGLPEKALSEIHRALTLAPLYEEPRLSLALYHHRRREFKQAEAAYLWASKARAGNSADSVTWFLAYRQLLLDVGSERPPATENP